MAPLRSFVTLWTLALSLVAAAPHGSTQSLATRQSSSKLVFCHFMIGVTDSRTSAQDYDNDMQQAKAAGIDAFALNIGIDTWTGDQLDHAYESAASNNMNVFISFDFNWYTTSMTSEVGKMIKTYGSKPGQLKVGGKIFISSFQGDGLDLDAVASASGYSRSDLFFAPNFRPNNAGSADALFNWMAWPNNGNNKAPDGSNNLTVSAGDQSYTGALGGKPYVAPISAWFSTHFGLEVSYSKNWVFPSDLLWFQRWTEILTLAPQFIEIITWNDYGESHYIGPLSSPHLDDGNSKYTNDMPHDGFLSMAKPYIAAYKSGSKTVDSFIDSDQLIYWYRPTLKLADCDSTDTCKAKNPPPNENYFAGKPNGYDTMSDSVFVVALLKSAGTVSVTSGGKSQSFPAQTGPNAFQVPMSTGKQSFALTRDGQTVFSGDSLKEISVDCVCGIYNFNAYVGTLPAGPSDSLQPDGLKKFAESMAGTCQASPSLGTASGAGTGSVNVPTAASSTAAPGPTSMAASSSSVSVSVTPIATPPVSQPALTSSTSPMTTAAAQPTTFPGPAPVQQPSSTTSAAPASDVGSKTITALSQLAPTNCMHADSVWAGPPGADRPAFCDGG